MNEAVGIGAVAIALIGVLTWVLKNKGEQDKWVQVQSERNALALEKTSTASILLAENVSKNTQVTEKMLQMLNKLLKPDV